MPSNSNRGVVYLKPGSVEVQKIDFPTFRNPAGKTIDHGVILKVVTTNICGSDQHMVRGRATAPAGTVLGHEITGEVIEKGRDVEYLVIGYLVSVRLGKVPRPPHGPDAGAKIQPQLMQAILWDTLPIAEIVNVKVIGLEQAPDGYKNLQCRSSEQSWSSIDTDNSPKLPDTR